MIKDMYGLLKSEDPNLAAKDLVSKSAFAEDMKPEELELLVTRIVSMGKVLFGLHIIDHPSIAGGKGSEPKVVSIQRKRAVIACFRQTSLHSLPKHAAINLFLR